MRVTLFTECILKFVINCMAEKILSLPAEHVHRDGKRIPLCSRVARKNLGLLLGISSDDLQCYDIYKSLDFAPIGSAVDVHRRYMQ